ncbi:hypothetical protein [Methylobacter sp.]|nr:hypothetical protein [Methylobacter sp.]
MRKRRNLIRRLIVLTNDEQAQLRPSIEKIQAEITAAKAKLDKK